MLFIEALNRVGTQPNRPQATGRLKNRPFITQKDSVDLSTTANEVKEIHLDSEQKTPLTASSSIFANLIEHILNHILNTELSILSPEELNIDDKEWRLFLQAPPNKAQTDAPTTSNSYQEPEIRKQPAKKQLRFRIPVKPAYGPPVEMMVLVSAHQGSPEIPYFFSMLPKENTLPLLKTPYTPEFIAQQITYYHILLDLDGEQDQLAPLYPLLTPPPSEEDIKTPDIYGLRLWRTQGSSLRPIVLGDKKMGLLYIGHYPPLNSQAQTKYESGQKPHYLYTKA
ncbi:hypothetical protein [Marinomonas pollencensis]|uniref:Uncharacterized protein n=1 Tax=Marinomonas pollencensis TaxID=491954 RepID=A0A3E0DPN3_9GAMM|nr:hypothetical protein [Marinomonas pollencensis]REG84917.1 hypothetical protein DFP81_103115 [Marinomonas pollencensis]